MIEQEGGRGSLDLANGHLVNALMICDVRSCIVGGKLSQLVMMATCLKAGVGKDRGVGGESLVRACVSMQCGTHIPLPPFL